MIKDTGERVIPEKMDITNNLLVEHIARYHFACEFVHGRVLDMACGSGYGSHIIAKTCKKKVNEVIGVDFDGDIIKYARGTYFHPLTTFIQGDITDLDLAGKLGQFDCIVSFETIEHLEDEKHFLANIYQMLKPNGTLIMSTPFGEGRHVPSRTPFHYFQLTSGEFKRLFADYRSADFYLQKGALIQPGRVTDTYFPVGIAICSK